MTDVDETWLPVPGYEGKYRVSSLGRVFSEPRPHARGGGIIHPRLKKRGYLTVVLSRDAKTEMRGVHQLVALAFLGPRPEKHEVRHLDGDPLNNRLTNLAYGTRSQQRRDDVRNGKHFCASKTHCPQGHPYDDINTKWYQGRRYCRACKRARGASDARKYRLRQRAS